MGLIASVFAYLIGVTALVVALLMSFDAFLYPSALTTLGQQTIAATAKPNVTQTVSMPSADARQVSPAVAQAAADGPHDGSENTASPRLRVHRLARQVRAGNGLFQRKPSVLGYAEEPSANFLYDRFQ